MATIKQLDDTIGKMQVQRDAILKQVNAIEAQIAALRKQLLTANAQQKPSLEVKMNALVQQKAKLTGSPTIQTEEEEPIKEEGEAVADSSAVIDTTDAAVFPFRAFAPKKFEKINVKKVNEELLTTFIDKLGD